MQYRTIPHSADQISSLGFGCMRFPTLANGNIDEVKSLEMLHYAYNQGVTYFDTAWPYHRGQSKILLGNFLQQIDRKKVFVATKLPCWLVKSEADFEHYFSLQLEHLQTDYIDYYLLHALNQKSWQQMKKLGVFRFIAKARRKTRYAISAFPFMILSRFSKTSFIPMTGISARSC